MSGELEEPGQEQVQNGVSRKQLLDALDELRGLIEQGDQDAVREAMKRSDQLNRQFHGLPPAADEAESAADRIQQRVEDVQAKAPELSEAEQAWLAAQTPEHRAGILREIEERKARIIAEGNPFAGLEVPTQPPIEEEGSQE